MTNEAVLALETELPIPLTCADGTGIAKGAILTLSDLGTVATATAANSVVGGIAGTEKIADDGMVRIDVYRGGIFRVKSSGSITVGDSVGTALTNYVVSNLTESNLSGSVILGTALESSSDEETILIEVNPQVKDSSI